MRKATFDRHVTLCYGKLAKVAESRHEGLETLHDALYELYAYKSYRKVHQKTGTQKMYGWMVQAIKLVTRNRHRVKGLQTKRESYMEDVMSLVAIRDAEQPYDPKAELIADVRTAIGKLSAYHQSLVIAVFYEGATLREIAARLGETYYRIFTEFEIAKAQLRELLKDYRSI